jgi:polar amino acid transport system substrate-binding protein
MTSRRLSLLAGIVLVVAACNGGGATPQPPTAAPPTAAPPTAAPPTAAPPTAAVTNPPATAGASASPAGLAEPVCDNLPDGSEGDLLATICDAGKIVMSTDPAYPPQSELDPGSELGYKGFDIDVGKAIADRLGVDIAFETPSWDVLTAGSWNGRWDFSVGSMTILPSREEVLDFTQAYYFTPAQMAVRSDSTIDSLDGLAGKVICAGVDTTYQKWVDGALDMGPDTDTFVLVDPPAGSTSTTLPTDRNCAESWQSGRHDFDGWLSSITTVDGAIADELPVKKVGDTVFFEPLAVAFDKSGPEHAVLLSVVDQIVGEMHADGTLSELSTTWFGTDYTVPAVTE